MKASLRIYLWLVTTLLSTNFLLANNDSTHILSVSEFIEVVKKFHPVAKQSNLLPQQAKEELNIARGGWDPLIYSDYSRKNYDGVNYYSYFENSIKIPTWYGIEVKAGYDVAYGQKLNSESKLPKDGLGYLGVSIPLGKNLFLDKQRAALKQAQIFRETSEQQRIILLNDLLYEALQTYYEWSYAYNEFSIYKNALELTSARFEATKKLTELGDRPSIDTIEALTQVQSRQFQLNEAQINFIKKSFALHNFLWLEDDTPMPFDSTLIPQTLNSEFLLQKIEWQKMEELETILRQTHPAIVNYNFKLKQLDVERRLKIENLKPVLNANYNLLSERFNFQSNTGPIFSNSYKFGFNFYMPLSFMQGRAELKIARLKISDTRYQLNLKTQELVNKVKSCFNELILLQLQTKLYEQSIDNFKKLLEGEEQRFRNGESSLFLVNARETKLLESQIKLRELQAKYFKTEAALKWAAGVVGQ